MGSPERPRWTDTGWQPVLRRGHRGRPDAGRPVLHLPCQKGLAGCPTRMSGDGAWAVPSGRAARRDPHGLRRWASWLCGDRLV